MRQAEWDRGVAAAHGIRTVPFDASLASALQTALANEPFDYLLSIANLRVIPANVLALPLRGAIDFHDGPLPRYAGLHATSWALLHGERTHGVTWHAIAGGIDEGDILAQELVEIEDDERALTLNAKCYEAGIRTFEPLCVNSRMAPCGLTAGTRSAHVFRRLQAPGRARQHRLAAACLGD